MKWLFDIFEKCRSELRQDPLFRKVFFRKFSGADQAKDSQWPLDQQIIALSLLSEGTAFDLYRTGIPMSEKLMILSGQYWSVPADGKMHHPAGVPDPSDDEAS